MTVIPAPQALQLLFPLPGLRFPLRPVHQLHGLCSGKVPDAEQAGERERGVGGYKPAPL